METTTKLMLERALAGVCAVLMAGAAQAALQDRDLDGNTVVDAFYDTDLDVTWLRDADVNGVMDWYSSVSWAENYTFGAYTDWRLPTSDQCIGLNCTGSEMGHLWYVELGNPAGGPMLNTGDFENLQSFGYYSSTVWEANPNGVMAFRTGEGYQGGDDRSNPYYAMTVRDGDVPSIPEPETYALMLAGLAGLAMATRRRAR